MAQGSDGEVTSKLFKVRGILRTGMRMIDRNTVITQLESAQDLLKAPNEVHEIAVLLKDNIYLSNELSRLQNWVTPEYKSGLRSC